jgi:hypothetical protein
LNIGKKNIFILVIHSILFFFYFCFFLCLVSTNNYLLFSVGGCDYLHCTRLTPVYNTEKSSWNMQLEGMNGVGGRGETTKGKFKAKENCKHFFIFLIFFFANICLFIVFCIFG